MAIRIVSLQYLIFYCHDIWIHSRLSHAPCRSHGLLKHLYSTPLYFSNHHYYRPPQVTGHAEPGRLLAILGPSGSGKTTLLNVLAGQVPASSALTLHGRLYVNGQLVSHSSLPSSSSSSSSSEHTQAYVRQQDIFYSQLTVRETLLMAARLRLPSSLDLEQKTALVDSLLKRLGLAKAADTIVGDDKIRGISGGEKKRLSLACELLGSPSLIFADEPTSEWNRAGRRGERETRDGIHLFTYTRPLSLAFLFLLLFPSSSSCYSSISFPSLHLYFSVSTPLLLSLLLPLHQVAWTRISPSGYLKTSRTSPARGGTRSSSPSTSPAPPSSPCSMTSSS